VACIRQELRNELAPMREDLARVSSRLREGKEEDVENCARVSGMLSGSIYHEGLRRWHETDISVRSDGSSLQFSRFPVFQIFRRSDGNEIVLRLFSLIAASP